MLQKRKNTFLFIAALLLGLLFLVIIFFYSHQKLTEVDFLDVGQGDAALIKIAKGKTILIDGGPDNLVLKRLGENLPFFKRKIDLVILSHSHDDHVIGLLEILYRYKIDTIIYVDDVNKPEFLAELL